MKLSIHILGIFLLTLGIILFLKGNAEPKHMLGGIVLLFLGYQAITRKEII